MKNVMIQGFTFFISFMNVMRYLTNESRGKVLTAMMAFVFDDKLPDADAFDDKDVGQKQMMEMAWEGIYPHLVTSRNKSHAGKAGAPIGNANAKKTKGKQSKNNQTPFEEKNEKLKTIEESMVDDNDIDISSFPFVPVINSMWESSDNKKQGLTEAMFLQSEISKLRDSSPVAMTDDEYVKFLVYWTTPLDAGDYAGHCRYIKARGESGSFNVRARLESWKNKIEETRI